MQRRLPRLGFMFRFEGTVRHCLLWRARSHRHDDLRDTTAETYWARALFPPLLLDHTERVASMRHESRHLPQPRTPIMGPGLRRDDASCGAFAPNELPRIQFSNSQITGSFETIIASDAKQSMAATKERWIASLRLDNANALPTYQQQTQTQQQEAA